MMFLVGLLRRLFYIIGGIFYRLINDLYDIFYKISSATYFTSEDIAEISRNIYLIVSVCMLFALGIRLLSAIVNPDSFNDSKKGAKRTFINCIIAVVLIAVIPKGFELAYKAQHDLVKDNFVATLVLGQELTNNDSIGEVIAKSSFGAFCSINEDIASESTKEAWNDLMNDYSDTKFAEFGEHVNDHDGWEWEVNYHMLLSPVFGFYMFYQMILLCLDVATRAIRLTILELMAPLVICGFIFSGTETLQKWFKDVISTYVIIFAKIIGLVFACLLLSKMDEIMGDDVFSDLGFISRGIVKAALLIAVFTIIKQLPTMINAIFGTNISDQGGIKGRLSNMAGIGNLASNAWGNFTSHPIQSAKKVVSAPIAAAQASKSYHQARKQRMEEIEQKLKDEGMDPNKAKKIAKKSARRGETFGGTRAAVQSAKKAWQTGSLSGSRAPAESYKDRHPIEASDDVKKDMRRLARGEKTRYEEQQEQDKYIIYEHVNAAGQTIKERMTVDQLNNIKSQNQAVADLRDSIKQQAIKAITDDDSNIKISIAGLGEGNYDQLSKTLMKMSPDNLKQGANESDADFEARKATRRQEVINLENELTKERNKLTDAVMDYGVRHQGDFTNINGYTLNGYTVNSLDGNAAVSGKYEDSIKTSVASLNGMKVGTGANGVLKDLADLSDANKKATTENNNISTQISAHQQAIYTRDNTPGGRALKADHDAAKAAMSGSSSGGSSSSGGNK